jgi:hypothetical protein
MLDQRLDVSNVVQRQIPSRNTQQGNTRRVCAAVALSSVLAFLALALTSGQGRCILPAATGDRV